MFPSAPFKSRRSFFPFFGFVLATAAVPPAIGQEAITATQDAFVRSERFADENFNTAWLGLAGRTRDHNRKIYLQFELPRDAGKTTRAVLRLTPRNEIKDDGEPSSASSVAFRIFASIQKDTGVWGETEITWNNAPGNAPTDPTKADFPWIEVGRGTVNFPLPSTEEPIEIPLPTLPAELKKESGGTLTLILTPEEERKTIPGVVFFSKEGTGKNEKRPTLLLFH